MRGECDFFHLNDPLYLTNLKSSIETPPNIKETIMKGIKKELLSLTGKISKSK